jgi:hypothetical protein
LIIPSVATAAPPANDLCENARDLGSATGAPGYTDEATFDDVGFCDTTNTAPGVWFTKEGTGDVMHAMTGIPTFFATKISVFCADCDDLTCVTGVDEDPSSYSRVSWCSQLGATYLILVHGVDDQVGRFTLEVWSSGTPCEPDVQCLPEDPATLLEEQHAELLEMVESGEISGTGPGNSATGRLGALENMLVAALDLIDAGEDAAACEQLQDALKRADGEFPPPDFVQGASREEVASGIEAVMNALGCDVLLSM